MYIIKNRLVPIAIRISPFFIIYKYYINLVYIKEELYIIYPRTLKEKSKAIIQKLASIID